MTSMTVRELLDRLADQVTAASAADLALADLPVHAVTTVAATEHLDGWVEWSDGSRTVVSAGTLAREIWRMGPGS